MKYRVCGVVLASVVAATTTVQAGTTITSCGQVVSGRATLGADLDCSAHPGNALTLNGVLKLDGHQIIGNSDPGLTASTISCSGRCIVKGPGTVVGGWVGIGGQKVVAKNVTVSGAAKFGISGAHARLKGCTVVGNGVTADPPDERRGGVVMGGRIHLVDTIVQNNHVNGVLSSSLGIRAIRSTMTGNTESAALCASSFYPCADIASNDVNPLPRLHASTCEHSAGFPSRDPLGLCSLD